MKKKKKYIGKENKFIYRPDVIVEERGFNVEYVQRADSFYVLFYICMYVRMYDGHDQFTGSLGHSLIYP